MAIPTIVGVGAVDSSTGTITPGLPSGTQADDILLLFVETKGGESITVTGWEAAPNTPVDASVQYPTRLSVFWKRAGSSESAPTTADSGDHQIGGILGIRGCTTVGSPFFVSTGGTTAASTSQSGTSFTSYLSDLLVVNAFAQGGDGYTAGQFSAWTNASLANITERFDEFTDLGDGGGFAVATGERSATGSVSATTATFTASTQGAQWTAALIPSTHEGKPFIRSIGSAQGNTAAVDLLTPPQYLEDDVLLALVETANETVTASGWTEAGGSPASNSGTNATRLTVLYRRAAASEGANVGSTSDSGEHQVARVIAIGGATDATDPFDVTNSDSGGTDTAITIPGATTTADKCLVIAAAATTRRSSSTTTFSDWTNSDLSDLAEIVDNVYNLTITAGGGIGAAYGYKNTAGAYGSTTATQLTSVEYAGWTGAIAGMAAVSPSVSADDSALTLTGSDATLVFGTTLFPDSGSFTLTGQNAIGNAGWTLLADAGVLTLGSSDSSVWVPTPETFTLSFVVDLHPSSAGNYQRHAHRLTVDGRSIPVRSWSWEESDRSLAGTLQVELADVTDRAHITRDSSIVFQLGTWNGTSYDWENLLDSGRLQRTDYSVSRNGIGPADTFTFTGYSEMDDRLNACPGNNVVLYDPGRHTVSASDIEGIWDSSGNYYAPTVTARSGQTMHTLLHDVFVSRCGFASVSTNIPDFPVPIAEFAVGQPYVGTVGGIIGMFEPMFTALSDSSGLHLCIVDGTTSVVPGMPAPREVTTAKALSMGVAGDLARARALMISVSQERYTFDYFTDRVEIESDDDFGASGDFSGEFVRVQTITTYRDWYRASNPDRPVRTEMRSQTKDTFKNGTELIAQSAEHLYYDAWGRLDVRTKTTDAKVPDPDGSFVPTVRRVSEETENITWKTHPYNNKQYYRAKREVVKSGLVYVDSTNQQLGEDYVRDAVTVYRAGNVKEDMTGDWRKISTSVEELTPLRNGRVRVRTVEVDHLQDQYAAQDEQERDGEVGVNIFVNEQQKIVIFEPGVSNVTGAVEQVNMGELPLTMAVSLGKRLLRRRLFAPERVAFTIPGADLSLEKGSAFTAKGRGGEDLGAYIVEGRSIRADQNGLTMNIQARSAEAT